MKEVVKWSQRLQNTSFLGRITDNNIGTQTYGEVNCCGYFLEMRTREMLDS